MTDDDNVFLTDFGQGGQSQRRPAKCNKLINDAKTCDIKVGPYPKIRSGSQRVRERAMIVLDISVKEVELWCCVLISRPQAL